MKRIITIYLFGLCIIAQLLAQNPYPEFRNPPQEARPQVWWHWIDGNITKEGIKADLEWMHRIGVGGIHQFDAGGAMMAAVQPIMKKVPYMQDEWKEAFAYAVAFADSLGMDITIASAPGWSSTGGPWVKPEDAMKKITWKSIETVGNTEIQTLVLPEAYDEIGRYQNEHGGNYEPAYQTMPRWYQDVAVVAVKVPEADMSMESLGAEISASGGDFSLAALNDGDIRNGAELPINKQGTHSWIQYSFPQPQTIRSLTFAAGEARDAWGAVSFDNALLCSDDGTSWREICKVPVAGLTTMTMTIPETTAKHFRIMVINPVADMSYAAYGVPVQMPTGTKVTEFALHTVSRINHAEEKAGFITTTMMDFYPTPETDHPVLETVDLTELMAEDGTLTWNVPEGKWRIYRFGASLTGKTNHPAPPEATGLEVDKLDEKAWTEYLRTYLDMYKDAAGGLLGEEGIRYLLFDSYEAGQMTWTPQMKEAFRKQHGYDLVSWLPVLAGEIIKSSSRSEQFLFDWRETIAGLMSDNYERSAQIVKDYGMAGTYIESHESGRSFIGDGMQIKKSAAIPMSAIWMMDRFSLDNNAGAQADMKESASVAHIYGQNIAALESFTTNGMGGNAYSYHPGNMKQTADLAILSGINRFVIHESAHQPSDEHVPGLGLMVFGQWFNRHETWAEQAKHWMDYLGRSSYLLQQGQHVADILWYYGEDTNITAEYGARLPDVPYGYSYDFVNPDALLNVVSEKEGKLVTPSGMSYKILVMDCGENMSPEVQRKIQMLSHAGIAVCSSDPEEIADALRAKGIKPDFTSSAPEAMRFVHRKDDGRNIYWVRNFSDGQASAEISLRDAEGAVTVLDPETGLVCNEAFDGKKIELAANQALFIIADKNGKPAKKKKVAEIGKEIALDGVWKVVLDGLGAPSDTLEYETLASLTESCEPGVKYFSGTATYTNTFTFRKKKEIPDGLAIDLGDVGVMAELTINGEQAGFLWKEPYRTSFKGKLKKGINTIEVKVTNLWPNRLIGDAQPGVEKVTHTVLPFYHQMSPLSPSGLIGPVKLNLLEH